jgi:uncharacterized membrane protein
METEKKPDKPAKGYGKMSRKQWVLIYIVAAVIVYAAIYLLFFHKSDGSGGSLGY